MLSTYLPFVSFLTMCTSEKNDVEAIDLLVMTIASEWTKAVPLKDNSTHLKEWSLVAVSYNRSVKIRIKAADKVLYFIQNFMI